MMNINKLRFYFALSRLPLIGKSYILKIMFIACFGLFTPIFTLIVYLAVNSSLNLNNELNLIVVVLFATLFGTITALFLLYWLLLPLLLVSNRLHKYFKEEQIPQFSMATKDTMGQIMTNVQYVIEKLDLFNQSLEYSQAIDPLTGVPNRRVGTERLRQDMARIRREESQILVALFDVEQVKEINEQFGYYAGDACLTQIGETISKNIRQGDWLARWSGNQFIVVLWNCHHKIPTTVLERIQPHSVQISNKISLPLHLNIGACEYRKNTTSLCTETDMETLLIRINEALSQAKEVGFGSIVFARSNQDMPLIKREK